MVGAVAGVSGRVHHGNVVIDRTDDNNPRDTIARLDVLPV